MPELRCHITAIQDVGETAPRTLYAVQVIEGTEKIHKNVARTGGFKL